MNEIILHPLIKFMPNICKNYSIYSVPSVCDQIFHIVCVVTDVVVVVVVYPTTEYD